MRSKSVRVTGAAGRSSASTLLSAIRRTIFKELKNDEPHAKTHSNGTSNVFITSANYEDQILKLMDSGERVSAAVAFLGDGCDDLLGRSTASVRLLCNLLSGTGILLWSRNDGYI